MTNFFSPDYATARDRFRAAVFDADGQLESIALKTKGPAGEDLTIDIGWFGSTSPRRAFVHSSGLHGVEGYAGSAIQLQWLSSGLPALRPDDAIAIVHSLNPYGMAWHRRTNENNVDLNRNFLGADEEYTGAPELYASMNLFLNPESPPARDFFGLRAAIKGLRYGKAAMRQAILGGQYDFPRGLFYGGTRHEQEARRFQIYLTQRLMASERITAIDVHTGLGEFGQDSLLVESPGDDPARIRGWAEMQTAYGDRLHALDPAGGLAYRTRGAQSALYHRMFGAAKVYFAVQEFGTYPLMKVLPALRDENRAHHFGSPEQAAAARAKLLSTLSPPDEAWRAMMLARGREVIQQGLTLAFERAV